MDHRFALYSVPSECSLDPITGKQSTNLSHMYDIINNLEEDYPSRKKTSNTKFNEFDSEENNYINTSCDMDRRLYSWERNLQQRRMLSRKIARKTGKRPSELLFNRCSTVDDRDKRMVQRIIDHAHFPKPQSDPYRRGVVIYGNNSQCERVEVLRETVPNAAQIYDNFEISGLPTIAKEELFGKNANTPCSPWITSGLLKQRIEENKYAIKGMVPFFPDIDNLQVIGKSVTLHERNAAIELAEHRYLDRFDGLGGINKDPPIDILYVNEIQPNLSTNAQAESQFRVSSIIEILLSNTMRSNESQSNDVSDEILLTSSNCSQLPVLEARPSIPETIRDASIDNSNLKQLRFDQH